MLKRSPPPSRQADHTVALRDEWHRFHLGQVRSAAPRSGPWPRCVLWLDEGSIPELTHYDGDVRYAAQVLQKAAEENGTFAEKVQIVVHATRKLGEQHQVLYSAIPLSRWTEMMAYAAQAEEAIPVYLLPGLAVQRCTPKAAVLMCFSAFLCLVWEEAGALQLRSSPMGLDSDVTAALRNMVEQAATGDEQARRFAYGELELFDFRDPAVAADAPLEVDEWWPKSLALRAWFNAADGNTLRRQFERLGGLADTARVKDLCNPAADHAALLARQFWPRLQLVNALACLVALGLTGLLGWQAWRHHQAGQDLGQRLSGLNAQAETLRAQTRPQAEASTQSEFLTQAFAAGYRQPGALAEWLGRVKSAVPPEMVVLSLGLERDDKTPRKPGVAEPVKGIRLDAALAATVDNKSAVLSQFVRQLENQGFTVRSRRSPSQANAGGSGESESSEVVTYLIDRSAAGGVR